MTEQLLKLLADYGLYLLAPAVALSCLGVPVPTSILLLMSGSLAAAGDFNLLAVLSIALSSAVAGDQIGFQLGRRGQHIVEGVAQHPKLRNMVVRAQRIVQQKGARGVFFSRWLVSPLGPYVNLVGGAMNLRWLSFTIAGTAGEAIWVCGYVALGYLFSQQIFQIADIAADFGVFLALGLIAFLLGRYLFKHTNPAVAP